MKIATTEKLKFKRLQRKLDLPLWQAIGLLESIWKMTYRNAPAGDVGRLSNEDIAAAIEWKGDADSLVVALTDTGWLDADPVHRLLIHDWEEECEAWHRGNFLKYHKEFAKPATEFSMSVNGATYEPPSESATNDSLPTHSLPSHPSPTSSEVGGGEFESSWTKAKPVAERIRTALDPDTTRPLSKSDREWAMKVAILGVRYGPGWIDPAFEAIKNTKNIKTSKGLMGKVLNDECERFRTNLNHELAGIRIPSEMLNPPEKQEIA